MPGFNQRGPVGEGPMTGRKQGKCANKGRSQMRNNQLEQTSEGQSFQQEDTAPRGFGFRRGLKRRNASGRGLGCRS